MEYLGEVNFIGNRLPSTSDVTYSPGTPPDRTEVTTETPNDSGSNGNLASN